MNIVENIKSTLRNRGKKIFVWIISFLLAGFFLVSAAGWFLATYMIASGKLGPKSADYQSLNIFDHIVRASQVLIVISASVALLLQKRIAVKLYLTNLIASIICIVAKGKWGITFVTPLPVIVVYAYTYWINRLGYLK